MLLRYIGLLTVPLILNSFVFAGETTSNCQMLSNNGKFLESIDACYSAIKDFPYSYENYYFKCQSEVGLGKYHDALTSCLQSIYRNEKHTESYFKLWIAYKELGDNSFAIKSFLKVYENDPQLAESISKDPGSLKFIMDNSLKVCFDHDYELCLNSSKFLFKHSQEVSMSLAEFACNNNHSQSCDEWRRQSSLSLIKAQNEANTVKKQISLPPVEKSEPDLKYVSDIQTGIKTGKRKAGKYDIAVVVGNQSYTAGAPNVDYALRDASTFREYLVRTMGYDDKNIIYAENATGSRLNEIFGNDVDHRGQLFKWIKEGESNVFIYYVGHGAPDPETGDAYFVPIDSNPSYLKTSGYRLKTFYDNLERLPAKSITIVLDACFSGNSNGGLLFKDVSSIAIRPKEIRIPAKFTIFASARDDQMSNWYSEKQHSLFTYYFAKGLQGDADTDGDKIILVEEMEAYLKENISYMARRLKGAEQNPVISGMGTSILAELDQ